MGRFGKELVGCGHMRKDQPRIGANPALRAPRIRFAFPHLNSAGLSQVFFGNLLG